MSALTSMTSSCIGVVAVFLLMTPAVVYADLAAEVVACPTIEFSTCAALQQAAAGRKNEIAQLATKLVAADTATDARVKLALALSLVDAREHVDAVESAAKLLAGQSQAADLRAAQARLGDVRAIGPLTELLKNTNDVHGQLLAAGGLGLLRAKQALPVLLATLNTTNGQLQAEVARTLGVIGDQTAQEALIALAGKPTCFPPARVAALRSLGDLNSARGAAVALLLADHPLRQVGQAALDTLRRGWQPWMAPAVVAAAQMPGLRGEAARTAVEHGLPAVVPYLLQVARKGESELDELGLVLLAIAHFKPAGAAAMLVERLAKAPKAEKVEIFRILPKVGDRTVVPDLVPWLQDADNQIVSNAVYALENLTGRHLGPDIAAWRQYSGTQPPSAPPQK